MRTLKSPPVALVIWVAPDNRTHWRAPQYAMMEHDEKGADGGGARGDACGASIVVARDDPGVWNGRTPMRAWM